jgi:hypothetical protein
MKSVRPSFCSESHFGIPQFDGSHPHVERIKEQTIARKNAGQTPRDVYLVFKFTTRVDQDVVRWVLKQLHRGFQWLFNARLRSILHWAFRIEETYFELHRFPQSTRIDFVARDWDTKRRKLIVHGGLERFGKTFMTDAEFLDVGKAFPISATMHLRSNTL